MKKINILFGTIFSLLLLTQLSSAQTIVNTDLNNDGVVDSFDFNILNMSLGPCEKECVGDFNHDNNVDNTDLDILIALYETNGNFVLRKTDVNNDLSVDVDDLIYVVLNWEVCEEVVEFASCPFDINIDGVVNEIDLNLIRALWNQEFDDLLLPIPIVADNVGVFNSLLDALASSGLLTTLTNFGQYTVFAPTDEAFASLPDGTLEALLNDTEALTNVLLYHMVIGELYSTGVIQSDMITTLEGSSLEVSIIEGDVFVEDSKITTADVLASNGVIHVVDRVLIPEEDFLNIIEIAQNAETFSTLLTALEVANLTSTLEGNGPYTVFAPTDEAFASLPDGTLEALLNDTEALTNVLLYHVIDGYLESTHLSQLNSTQMFNGQSVNLNYFNNTLMVNSATVISPDIMASNGIIHVINEVLIPPMKMIYLPNNIESKDKKTNNNIKNIDIQYKKETKEIDTNIKIEKSNFELEMRK